MIVELYQNSQRLTHAAGALSDIHCKKCTEVQWDIGAALGTDDGADEFNVSAGYWKMTLSEFAA